MSSPITAEVPLTGRPVEGEPMLRRKLPSPTHLERVEVEVQGATFEVFYREHRNLVTRALALAIGDRDLAAESVDEAMIRAYQRWSRVSMLDNPAAWVYRVALNQATSRFRRVARKARHRSTVSQADVVHHDHPFGDSLSEPDLARALHDLPDHQRSVVVVRVLLGFSEQEAATALDIRPGTVKSRLHRALTRLRAQLPHLDYDLHEETS